MRYLPEYCPYCKREAVVMMEIRWIPGCEWDPIDRLNGGLWMAEIHCMYCGKQGRVTDDYTVEGAKERAFGAWDSMVMRDLADR